MNLRRNIILYHQAALGDFIVTWPLAMALSRVFPQSRIIYVTGSDKGALAERVLRVESADVEAGWHLLHADPPQKLPERAARMLESAHTVIGFAAGSTDTAFARGVRALAPHVELVQLDTKRAGDEAVHVIESIRSQLAPWPMIQTALTQMLRSVESRGTGFHTSGDSKVVIIHPGAGKQANRWPVEKFAELAGALRAKGRAPRFVIGEVEAERWRAAEIAQLEASGELCRPATLVELLETMSGGVAFLGNDSGPAHLAGVIGLPTVALFGPTDPARWKPLGPRVTVIRREPIERIGVEEVLATLLALPSHAATASRT